MKDLTYAYDSMDINDISDSETCTYEIRPSDGECDCGVSCQAYATCAIINGTYYEYKLTQYNILLYTCSFT